MSTLPDKPPPVKPPATGWTWVDNRDIDLIPMMGATAFAVYVGLARRTNSQRRCWPSVRTLAAELGMSPATVRRALRRMAKLGRVTITRRQTGTGDADSNLYYLPPYGGPGVTGDTTPCHPCNYLGAPVTVPPVTSDTQTRTIEEDSAQQEDESRRDDHVCASCSWSDHENKTLSLAQRVAKTVQVKRTSKKVRRADRSLILKACFLVASGRMPEAWLWDSIEAVRQTHPSNGAAYLHTCLEEHGSNHGKKLCRLLRTVTIPPHLIDGKDA